jgi:hypothetical protein
MVEFTPDAEARLAEYLRQVRAAVAGSPDVSPDEVEADIREHVENEFRLATRPVTVAELEAVLAQLGPPSQWLPAAARPAPAPWLPPVRQYLRDRWRAAREAVWRGPEDWRLAYLAFAVFAAGVLTFFLFPLCLVVSYLLARAGIAAAREKGVELGAARKWLLYPPVAIVSTALLAGVLLWPVAVGGVVGEEVARARGRVAMYDRPDPDPATLGPRDLRALKERVAWRQHMSRQVEEDRQLLAAIPVAPDYAAAAAALFVAAGAFGLWWTVLGFVGARFPGAARAVFTPLCDGFDRGRGLRLGFWSLFVFAAWCAVAYRVATDAGAL